MLSRDLGLGPHLVDSIGDVITRGGGSLTDDVSHADMFICCYREGSAYCAASRLGKDVGSLSWLYHLITFNTWTSPLRRLLHYPVARGGIPDFRGKKISLSNYVGEARVYLENLIRAAGAECTKTLTMENTHLVTAHGNSEKCAAAKEWGLEVVNHLWLEESYACWHLLPVSNPRYTHFPRRTNLSEVVGQTRLDKAALEYLFFPSSEDHASTPPVPRPVVQNNKKKNVALSTVPGSSAPASSGSPKPMPPPEARPNNTPNNTRRSLVTPGRPDTVGGGKENDTPSSTSSRKSKDTAAARLHNLAPDIALYEREKKRVGGVLYGGTRKSHEDARPGEKRPSPERPEPESASESEEVTGTTKKQKKTKPAIQMRLLITGYQRWIGNMKKEDMELVSAAYCFYIIIIVCFFWI